MSSIRLGRRASNNSWIRVLIGFLVCFFLFFSHLVLAQHNHEGGAHALAAGLTTQGDSGGGTPHPAHDHPQLDRPGHSDHSVDAGHSGQAAVHQMYFFASTNSTILFLDWTTSSWKSLLLACLGIFLLALTYEGLTALSQYITSLSVTARRTNHLKSSKCSKAVYFHLLQSLLHIVILVVGYSLMLVVMTFNVWLLIPIVLGCGLGYLVIRWKTATSSITDQNETDTYLTDSNELKECH